jgi:hypothetical protein
MSNKISSKSTEQARIDKDFMLREYDRIHQLWLEENKQVEQRVNFFLAILTATVGAIVFLFQSATLSETEAFYASEGILLLILLFGFSILNRLLIRNVQLKVFRAAIEEIQNYFAAQNEELDSYLSKVKKLYRGEIKMNGLYKFFYYLFNGSLTSLMILSNSLICGGIVMVALIFARQPVVNIALWTTIAVLLTSFGFRLYDIKMHSRMVPWKYY